MPITKKTRLSFAIALVCGGVAGSAQASGFRVPEGSIAGMGLSNAMVANPNEPGALSYNPAAMAFHPGKTLVGGLIVIDPSNEVAATNFANSSVLNTDANGKDQFFKPGLYYMDHFNSQWSWGVNIEAPFGLETKWPANTFPNYAILGAAPFEPEKSSIEMVNINPNISYKVNPDTSVAFGVDYYYVKNVSLNTQGLVIEGDGNKLGWNAAIMHKTGPVTLGLSYRSSVDTKIKGSVSGFGASGGANTSVNFPSILQMGIHYQVNQKLALEFDYDRTSWSSFDKIEVNHNNPNVPVNPIVSKNNWSNADAFRFGVTYDIDSVNRLRFGYALDKTPQSEAYFSARVPDNDRQLFSIGYGRKVGSWMLDAGYMYVRVDDRTIAEPIFGPTNGLSNGTYKSVVHLFGLGFSTSF